VADPITLYKKPKNKFVAGFIGSPPMNLISGMIKKDAKQIYLSSTNIKLRLNRNFEKYLNRPVVIGIRPTDFSTASGSELKVVVDVIEPMGNELYVYGRCGDNMLSARVPEDALPKVGQPFLLKINPEKLYIFDEKTEKAI